MRCLLFLTLCVASTLAIDLSSYRVPARVEAPNVQLHFFGAPAASRTKRDIRIHDLDDPNDCIQNCTRKLHDGLEGINDTDSEEVRATTMCKAVAPVESCYKTCPDSQYRNLTIDFLPLLKQPCLLGDDKFPELKTTLNCLNSTEAAIAAKCDPVCNGSFAGNIRLKSRIILSANPAFVIYDDDKTENRDLLKSTCSFITCTQQCGDSITKAKCGQKALDVDHKIMSSIFGSITKLYSDLNALDGDVKECKALL